MEFPALFDTGAVLVALTTKTAKILDITNYPQGPTVDDRGMVKSYMVPIKLKGLDSSSFLSPVIVSDAYPDGNIVPSELLMANGYDLTFNLTSLELF